MTLRLVGLRKIRESEGESREATLMVKSTVDSVWIVWIVRIGLQYV